MTSRIVIGRSLFLIHGLSDSPKYHPVSAMTDWWDKCEKTALHYGFTKRRRWQTWLGVQEYTRNAANRCTYHIVKYRSLTIFPRNCYSESPFARKSCHIMHPPHSYPVKFGCASLYSPYLLGKKLFSMQDKLVNYKQTHCRKQNFSAITTPIDKSCMLLFDLSKTLLFFLYYFLMLVLIIV